MSKPENNMQKFSNQNKRKFHACNNEDEDDVELSLGLSLNGKFGINPKRCQNFPMVRSSSVSNFCLGELNMQTELGRTSSMPTVGKETKRKKVGKTAYVAIKICTFQKKKKVGKTTKHGLLVSTGSGLSSEDSELELQQANTPIEALIPGSAQSPPKQKEQKQAVPVRVVKPGNPSAKSTKPDAKEVMRNMMRDIPCVSTEGPSGKRMEGFLYRYGKGEEVRIVCICHGSFSTPAEFVKHAGSGDVLQPLKHIHVNPSLL